MTTVAWIEAAQQLPDEDTLVLIALENGEVWPAARDHGRWIYMSGGQVLERVTHWMHLPAAPTGVAA